MSVQSSGCADVTAVMARLGLGPLLVRQVSLPFMAPPPTIQLGSLGMADTLILMVMALVVFGPRRLPQIGRQIGKLMYEFRKASNDFKYQMEEELRNSEEADRRQKEEERQRQLALAAPAQPAETVAAVQTESIPETGDSDTTEPEIGDSGTVESPFHD